MPNTQTHLAAVSDLLAPSGLPAAIHWLADSDAQAAFLMGTISPDVRAVSGQTREATHFIPIPPPPGVLAQQMMLDAWPELRPTSVKGQAQAAFVAGYIAHLIMDQTWLDTVVLPGLFIDGVPWNTRHPNWRLYSILMTYLEYQGAARMPAEIPSSLACALPDHWVPFIEDRYLVQWRNHVIQMIKTEGARRTSHIFAHSNNMTAEELERIVLSEERMAEEAYPVIPREWLLGFEQETDRRTQAAVISYLSEIQP